MLKNLIIEGNQLMQNPEVDSDGCTMWVNQHRHDEFLKWEMKALMFIQDEYKGNFMVPRFMNLIDGDRGNGEIEILTQLVGILEAFEQIQPKAKNVDYATIISGIFEHFHACALQLKRRRAGKQGYVIEDEYDVQDLLHALLKLNFSDVRPEEWTPSYAGNSNRMDFLLKEAKVAIEVKMTRSNLKDKEIGEQLIIDIAKYKQHPDVKTLYCFVYDPECLIHNPVGIENDLNLLSTNAFTVKVFVRPC